MKVAYLIEYFPPYAAGGSEWSTYYLAQQLSDENVDIVLITPNYGQKKLKGSIGFEIVKFPFYKKIKNSCLPGNFFFTNPLWIIWTAIAFLYFVQKEKIDIIHVQGKYCLPGARLANLFLKKPLIVTLRDYQPICNYGICLYNKYKACNIEQYITSDFQTYYRDYVMNKSPIKFMLNVLFAIWGRLAKNILAISAKNVKIVVLSNYQKSVYLANGFKDIDIIGNSILSPKASKADKKDILLYIGRLTPGKGVQILISAIPKIIEMYPKYHFLFIGDGFLKEKLKLLRKRYKNIKLPGQLDHDKTIQMIKKAKLSVIPSVWPEPFGRVVAESLVCKTPVVVTNRGALPELINKRWGRVSEASPRSVLTAIKNVLDNNKTYEKNIRQDYKKLLETFTTSTPKKYLKLYREVSK